LDYRVEALVEIRDASVRKQLLDTLKICWRDNVKARKIDATRSNPYLKRSSRAATVRSQKALYEYYKKLATKPPSSP
ncbi:MAG: polyphosphate kinase 1, partial [Nannocystaceae bacterium]